MRQIYLIGIGMGNPDTLTVGAQKIIARSDCLIGAKRMLQTVNHPTARQFSSFRNEEIAEYIAQQPKSCTISVLLSGDTGFYSGAKKLAGLLKSRFPDDRLAAIFLRQAANRLGRRQAFQRPRQAGAGRAAGAPPSAGVCADRQQPDCAGRLQTAV